MRSNEERFQRPCRIGSQVYFQKSPQISGGAGERAENKRADWLIQIKPLLAARMVAPALLW